MNNSYQFRSFGACLLSLRQRRNLSQKALSILAGMDQSYLAGLEAGKRAPPKEKQICRLINALEASTNEEHELRTAHAYSKIVEGTNGLSSEVLAALSLHLQRLSDDEIKVVEHTTSVLSRQESNTEHSELFMT